MKDFNSFLDHILKNFAASFPYGLSKTDVVRLTFASWCEVEAKAFREESAKQPD